MHLPFKVSGEPAGAGRRFKEPDFTAFREKKALSPFTSLIFADFHNPANSHCIRSSVLSMISNHSINGRGFCQWRRVT